MTQPLAIKDPKVVTGLAIMVFSGIVACEGVGLHSLPELALAGLLGALGWQVHRGGMRSKVGDTAPHQLRSRWMRFLLVAPPVFVGSYVLGYVALMDRHLPPYPHDSRGRFESSFRWAAKQRAGKGTGPETQFPEVTIWNVIYRPLDVVYFRVFPRRDAEVERLRELGYYR